MRVWVTRDEERDGPLGMALRSVGLHDVWQPMLQRQVSDTFDISSVNSLEKEDWLVLTSPFAIEYIARLTQHRIPRVAVVGKVSQQLAAALGFRVAIVSTEGISTSLFADLKQHVLAAKICYPRSSLAKPLCGWGNAQVTCPILYETKPRDVDPLGADKVDIIAIASASAARAVGLINLPYASIGPSTTSTLRGMGIEPAVEAPDRSFSSLASAIAAYAKDSRQDRA